jgi:AraC family transcriptional regulator
VTLARLELNACAAGFGIHEEAKWRVPPGPPDAPRISRLIAVSRWRGPGPAVCVQSLATGGGYHTVAINLKEVEVTLKSADTVLHEGLLRAGMVQVSDPDTNLCLTMRGAYDWLHMHVSNLLLARCMDTKWRRRPAEGIALLKRTLVRDPVIENLARALLNVGDSTDARAQHDVEGIAMALLRRLVSVHCAFAVAAKRSRATALVHWRLKRAIDYMEEHIADPITLPQLAAAVGLTRMYFAEQFRAATGLRPKEFFLRRRIEHAKRLLRDSPATLVDIALITGFQTQSHFTTVFKRFVGSTPHQWRCATCPAPPLPAHPNASRLSAREATHSGRQRSRLSLPPV